MKNFLSILSKVFLLVSNISFSVASNELDYTTYQMEHREVSLQEAQDVIYRTIGSGSISTASGEIVLTKLKSKNKWFENHQDVKVFGGVPFYGPRGLLVANEYYLQCGDTLCGSLYEVFPGKKDINEVMNLFIKGAKCIDIYGCKLQSDGVGDAIATFFIPDAVPTSIRLSESIPDGEMKFYHGIYAIREKDLKVISLDKKDNNLTRKELKKRLLGLVDFSMQSPSIPLVYQRARYRTYLDELTSQTLTLAKQRLTEKPYDCSLLEATSRDIYISNGDGTMRTEKLQKPLPKGTYYKASCLGIPGEQVLIFGNYSFLGGDYLTGRRQNAMYEVLSYLDLPL